MSVKESLHLAPEDLCWNCDPAQFAFSTTEELDPLDGTIGQDRALTAIEFGLGIQDQGFNIFVLGEAGTGRYSTIRKMLETKAAEEKVPDDWCYLHDFEDDNHPKSISLPCGKGKELHRDVEDLVRRLAEAIPKFFESKEFEQQKARLAEDYQEKNRQLFQHLEEEANRDGFTVQGGDGTLIIVPLNPEGKPLSKDDYEKLSADERKYIDGKAAVLKDRLNEVLQQARELEKTLRETTRQMAKDALLFAIGHLFEELEDKYREFNEVLKHFQNCKKDILYRIDEFRPAPPQFAQFAPQAGTTPKEESPLERYRVNLLVDNCCCQGAPVIFEANPTYFNLFGRIEHIIQMGNAITNFRMIKAGSLHRANGGYLVLDCRELFANPYTYEALKRCIRNREIKIEDMTEQFRMMAFVTLKPEPVPLNCKIILIGPARFYYLLFALDPDFRKFFKVKADFDLTMDNTEKNINKYARYVATRCRKENLLHFDRGGVARFVEYAARLVEDKNRLTSRFLVLSDLIREAVYYARQDSKNYADAGHVNQAIEAKNYRSNRVEERNLEFIEEGTVLIDTEGAEVGQINGLTVIDMGDYSFGKPARLTVRTYLGKGNVINLEREAKLSGPIHDKGVLILSGFFGSRYAQDKPLSLSASIAFEQSYGGIEGDSASSTELYALLSSLSGVPISQGIAVTGSVNQNGRIQPIGGVNQKIEGFFSLCQNRGLNGRQGVVIPIQNVKNLMLREEVVKAARNGEFHVWAVSTIDEGIEILTGVPAGEKRDDGTWPDGTINYLVDKKLKEYSELVHKQGGGNDNQGKS